MGLGDVGSGEEGRHDMTALIQRRLLYGSGRCKTPYSDLDVPQSVGLQAVSLCS